jgi:hypothetical protein
MVSDERFRELAGILVGAFYAGGRPHPLAPPKQMAVDSLFDAMKSNKDDVLVSLMRFHDWMHKHGVGTNDYQNYGCNDGMRPAGNGKVDIHKDDSPSC